MRTSDLLIPNLCYVSFRRSDQMGSVERRWDCSIPGELLSIVREKNTPETVKHYMPKDVHTRSWEFSCNSHNKTERFKGKEGDSLTSKVQEKTSSGLEATRKHILQHKIILLLEGNIAKATLQRQQEHRLNTVETFLYLFFSYAIPLNFYIVNRLSEFHFSKT